MLLRPIEINVRISNPLLSITQLSFMIMMMGITLTIGNKITHECTDINLIYIENHILSCFLVENIYLMSKQFCTNDTLGVKCKYQKTSFRHLILLRCINVGLFL